GGGATHSGASRRSRRVAGAATLSWPSRPFTTFSSASPSREATAMRKVLVIASREYLATVRTKGFIISLLLMPVLMSGGFLAQKLVGEQIDIRERKVAI